MKTKRKFKKFAGIATAALMTACLTVPMSVNFSAMATGSISISNTETGHTYEAYQIFAGDLEGNVLSNISWGAGVNITGLLDDIKTITLSDNSTPFSSCASAADVAKALSDAGVAKDAEITQKFADVVSAHLNTATGTTSTSSGDVYSITGLADGYYLVKDKTDSLTGDKTYTKYIVQVLGNVSSIAPKTDKPTLEKKIWHNDSVSAPNITAAAPSGDNWGDVADNQIGDTVYFYTKTSVPNMTYYDTYKYIIRDDMSDGLTLDTSSIKVVYVDSTDTVTDLTGNSSYTLTTADDASTNDFTEDFYISFADLKTALGAKANGGYIYTYYSATLNENALVSNSANTTQANKNTAYLTYSNNPNNDNSTTDTPQDIVYDWTFTFNGSKVDENSNPLTGAGFTLYDSDGTAPINLVAVDDVSKINSVTKADDTKYYRIAKSGETGTVTEMLGSSETTATKFMIIGLDDTKTYTLKETKTPAGYNTCDPISINLSDTYDVTGAELTALKNGENPNSTEIINKKGAELPSTGGIGTKVFYIGGGAMVAVAGVLLITKKRMKNSK